MLDGRWDTRHEAVGQFFGALAGDQVDFDGVRQDGAGDFRGDFGQEVGDGARLGARRLAGQGDDGEREAAVGRAGDGDEKAALIASKGIQEAAKRRALEGFEEVVDVDAQTTASCAHRAGGGLPLSA